MEMHQMWSIGRHICSISHFPGKVIVKYNPYNFNRNRKAIRLVYELYLDKTHLVVTWKITFKISRIGKWTHAKMLTTNK